MASDVIILFGGGSSERLVSVASAQNVSLQLPDAACWFLSKGGAVFLTEPLVLAAHERPFEQEFVAGTPPHLSFVDFRGLESVDGGALRVGDL